MFQNIAGHLRDAGVDTGRNCVYYPLGVVVMGIDVRPAMLARAHRRRLALSAAGRLHCTDVTNFKFSAATFDAAVAACLLCALPDHLQLAALRELELIVKAGGPIRLHEVGLKRKWSLDEPSPFEIVRFLDPEPVHGLLDDALASLKEYYPVFAPAQIAERWAGCIDAMPDAVPVMSPVDKLPGFYLATGFSGHGFGLGPGAGKLMADLVTGKTPCVDPSPFRHSRYFDGTNPRPATGL
jgi:hypothetical protein